MKMTTAESGLPGNSETVLDEAVNLFHDRKYKRAIRLLETLDKKQFARSLKYHMISGICYRKLKNYDESFIHFKQAVKIAPADETASQCLYVACVELDKSKLAIKELDRYLSKHPADSYKVTLTELLWELKRGNATDYMDTILKYVRKNKVKVPW